MWGLAIIHRCLQGPWAPPLVAMRGGNAGQFVESTFTSQFLQLVSPWILTRFLGPAAVEKVAGPGDACAKVSRGKLPEFLARNWRAIFSTPK